MVGVDDRDHYQKNVDAVRASKSASDEMAKNLLLLRAGLNRTKKQVFNKPLQAFDFKVQMFNSGAMSTDS